MTADSPDSKSDEELKQLLVNFAEEYRAPHRFMDNEHSPSEQMVSAQAKLLAETLPKLVCFIRQSQAAAVKEARIEEREYFAGKLLEIWEEAPPQPGEILFPENFDPAKFLQRQQFYDMYLRPFDAFVNRIHLKHYIEAKERLSQLRQEQGGQMNKYQRRGAVETLSLSGTGDELILAAIDKLIHNHQIGQPYSRNCLVRIKLLLEDIEPFTAQREGGNTTPTKEKGL